MTREQIEADLDKELDEYHRKAYDSLDPEHRELADAHPEAFRQICDTKYCRTVTVTLRQVFEGISHFM